MQISFVLSMPNNNSWNGKWTGEGNVYAIVKTYPNGKRSVEKAKGLLGYYRYDFGDGWAAGIAVEEIDAKRARKLRKQSNGFCGYDWMVDSIRAYGKILNSDEIQILEDNILNRHKDNLKEEIREHLRQGGI